MHVAILINGNSEHISETEQLQIAIYNCLRLNDLKSCFSDDIYDVYCVILSIQLLLGFAFGLQVTDLAFLDSGNKLVSSSKDKFLTVQDLDTKNCTQIIGAHHHSEVCSLDVDPDQRYLVIRSADLELRFYTIKHEKEFRTSNMIENIVVSIYSALTMSSIIEFRYSLEFK